MEQPFHNYKWKTLGLVEHIALEGKHKIRLYENLKIMKK
jgi:hypothetical protein